MRKKLPRYTIFTRRIPPLPNPLPLCRGERKKLVLSEVEGVRGICNLEFVICLKFRVSDLEFAASAANGADEICPDSALYPFMQRNRDPVSSVKKTMMETGNSRLSLFAQLFDECMTLLSL